MKQIAVYYKKNIYGYTTVDDDVYEQVGSLRFIIFGRRKSKYALNSKVGLLHRYILNAPKGISVDHINRDTFDNTRVNLRIANVTENNRNRLQQKNNKSGYKGVSFHKRSRRWRSQINYLGKRIHIGNFNSAKEAFDAYVRKSNELYGEFSPFYSL